MSKPLSVDELALVQLVMNRAIEDRDNAGCNDVPSEWMPHMTPALRKDMAAMFADEGIDEDSLDGAEQVVMEYLKNRILEQGQP